MTFIEPELERAIMSFAQRRALDTPDKAAGHCFEVSRDLARELESFGARLICLRGLQELDLKTAHVSWHDFQDVPDAISHYAVLVHGLHVDITARQFDPGAPYPLIQPATLSTWPTVEDVPGWPAPQHTGPGLSLEQLQAWIAVHGPYLYHGTEGTRLHQDEPSLAESIAQNGLRGNDAYHPIRSVYLSREAVWDTHDQHPAMFRVDMRELQLHLIEADEWQLMERDPHLADYDGCMEMMTPQMQDHLKQARQVLATLGQEGFGAVAYRADIPAQLLVQIKHPRKPTLMQLNHKPDLPTDTQHPSQDL